MATIKYTEEQLASLAARLRSMPPVQKKKDYNMQEVVRLLAKDVTAMQRRGYTLEQVSEIFREEGFGLGKHTLKSYTKQSKPVKKTPAGKPQELTVPSPAVKQSAEASKPAFLPKPDTTDI